MKINHLPEKLEFNKAGVLTIAIVVVFAVAAFFLTRPETAVQNLSPVSGLITLKATVQEAIPYEVAITNQKPTLIEFYADWCTTCQAMAPTLQLMQHQLGDQINFVMLNIDEPQWYQPIQQFQVRGVPHLVLLNSDQSVVDIFIGKVPKQIIANRIAGLLNSLQL